MLKKIKHICSLFVSKISQFKKNGKITGIFKITNYCLLRSVDVSWAGLVLDCGPWILDHPRQSIGVTLN